jgi:hypothetical protein
MTPRLPNENLARVTEHGVSTHRTAIYGLDTGHSMLTRLTDAGLGYTRKVERDVTTKLEYLLSQPRCIWNKKRDRHGDLTGARIRYTLFYTLCRAS